MCGHCPGAPLSAAARGRRGVAWAAAGLQGWLEALAPEGLGVFKEREPLGLAEREDRAGGVLAVADEEPALAGSTGHLGDLHAHSPGAVAVAGSAPAQGVDGVGGGIGLVLIEPSELPRIGVGVVHGCSPVGVAGRWHSRVE